MRGGDKAAELLLLTGRGAVFYGDESLVPSAHKPTASEGTRSDELAGRERKVSHSRRALAA